MPLQPTTVVLFGATGDLSRRKLLPGMLHLFQTGLMRDLRVVGTSLDEHDRDSFVEFAHEAVAEFGGDDGDTEGWSEFAKLLTGLPARRARRGCAAPSRRPRASAPRSSRGSTTSRCRRRPRSRWCTSSRRPAWSSAAGSSWRSRSAPTSASAQKLNAELHEVFHEDQIFRIDHFLGKEAAQNILAFRFANGLFEPIWHRNHIDHVQIDVPEELGLEQRASFYESTGAYRDMVVTHLFQVLAFTAMEPPTSLEPMAISEEKNKVFRSMCADRADTTSCVGSTSATATSRASPTTPRPRPSSRSSATSTTGAGPACRSTSAPASAWPRAPGSSPSPSGSRRARCSRPAPGWATTAPTT